MFLMTGGRMGDGLVLDGGASPIVSAALKRARNPGDFLIISMPRQWMSPGLPYLMLLALVYGNGPVRMRTNG